MTATHTPESPFIDGGAHRHTPVAHDAAQPAQELPRADAAGERRDLHAGEG